MFALSLVVLLILVTTGKGLRHPGVALSLILCVHALDQLAQAGSPFVAQRSWLPDTTVLFAATLCLVSAFFSGNYRFRGGVRPVQVTVVAYATLFLVSAKWGSFLPLGHWLGKEGPFFLLQAFIAPLLIGRPKDAAAAVQWSGWLCAIMGAYILLDPSIWADTTRRLMLVVAGRSEVDSNPLALGDMGAMAFIFAVLSPAFVRFRGFRSILCYAACAVGLLITAKASRGETIAALISGTTLFVLTSLKRSQRSTQFKGIIGLITIAAGAAVVVAKSTTGGRYREQVLRSGLELRLSMTERLFDRYAASPEDWLFGLGGGFSNRLLGSYPHNQFLQALAETGIVGATLWLLFLGLAFYSLASVWKYVEHDEEKRFAYAALAAMLTYHVILTFKRGRVLDSTLFMWAILADRFAMSVRETLSPRDPKLRAHTEAQGRPPPYRAPI